MVKINLGLVLLLILFIAGFAYRVYDLGHDSYWIDESYTVIASKNIGEYGYPKFDSGKNYWGGFPHAYALFVIGEIFGYSHIPMRILSVVLGVAFIVLVYFLIKQQFDEKTALLTTFFVALSYIEIAWSRQARGYIILQFLLFLSVLFYVYFLKNKEIKYLLFLLCSILIAIALHPAGLLIPIMLFIHYILIKRKSLHTEMFSNIKGLKIRPWLFVAVLALISIIVYFVYKELMKFDIVANYVNTYISFLFWNHYIFIFLAVIGLFAYKKNFQNNLLYVIMFAIVFIGATVTIVDVNFRYIFIVVPVLYLFSSQAILYFYELFKNKLYRIFVAIFFVVLIVLSGFLFIPKGSYALEYGTPQPPFKDAYNYVQDSITDDELLIVTQPAISELYFRKADYWLAIGYENRGIDYYVDKNTRIERYTGIISITNADELEEVLKNNGYIVIDDMGINRLSADKKTVVAGLELRKTYGSSYWSRVYVYKFGDNLNGKVVS